jgi:AAA15 family ATPase/GTPase
MFSFSRKGSLSNFSLNFRNHRIATLSGKSQSNLKSPSRNRKVFLSEKMRLRTSPHNDTNVNNTNRDLSKELSTRSERLFINETSETELNTLKLVTALSDAINNLPKVRIEF